MTLRTAEDEADGKKDYPKARRYVILLAMKLALPYPLSEPPARLKKAKLDNIALVPASLLPLKGTYQPIANNLPTRRVLFVPQTQR